jgi:hypothetical protein
MVKMSAALTKGIEFKAKVINKKAPLAAYGVSSNYFTASFLVAVLPPSVIFTM